MAHYPKRLSHDEDEEKMYILWNAPNPGNCVKPQKLEPQRMSRLVVKYLYRAGGSNSRKPYHKQISVIGIGINNDMTTVF